MSPQHLAGRCSFAASTESFLTQADPFAVSGYVLSLRSGIIVRGKAHVADTSYKRQVVIADRGMSGTSNRRNRCRRTSRACWSLAALSSWQLAQERSRKNSSWSIPRRSRPSRCTPANTSNTLTRWALSPASTTPQTDGHLAGEAASC